MNITFQVFMYDKIGFLSFHNSYVLSIDFDGILFKK